MMSNSYSRSVVRRPVGVTRSIGVSRMRPAPRSPGCRPRSSASPAGPAGAEAVILGDQHLRDLRVFSRAADLVGHELGKELIRLAVDQNVAEIAQPDREARRLVELLSERVRSSGLTSTVRGVGDVHEATFGLATALKISGYSLRISLHLRLRDGPVVERRTPVRPALEDGEMGRGLGDLRDELDGGGAGADHRDPLALEADRLGPAPGVVGLAPKSSMPAIRGMVGAESGPTAVTR